MTGCLSVGELAARSPSRVSVKTMRALLADLEARGFVEHVNGDEWRFAPGAVEYAKLFLAIRPTDPVPLAPDELERLCDPGPRRTGLRRKVAA